MLILNLHLLLLSSLQQHFVAFYTSCVVNVTLSLIKQIDIVFTITFEPETEFNKLTTKNKGSFKQDNLHQATNQICKLSRRV